MSDRYAIYLAPESGSALARFGAAWLGRDAETGAEVAQPELDGLAAARLRAVTEAPRHYGFHGTLKPPFHLAGGAEAAELTAALAAFAGQRRGFDVPELVVRPIGDFVALVPAAPSPALSQLAAECVVAFDCFRAPPDPAELAKRHAAGLSPRQAELLARWGYPYVLDEFRFHLTLTGALDDAAERARIAALAAGAAAPCLRQAFPVRDLCLFHQPDRATPFRIVARFPLAR